VKVAIAGGHGKIARLLEGLLVKRGESAIGLIRNPDHADDLRELGAEPVLCDLEGDCDVAASITGADVVVFAAGAGPGSGEERKRSMDLGGALKLIEAAKANGISRYLIVSSMGAAEPPGEGGGAFGEYLRAKSEADRALAASGLDYTIVRPGRLTDEPGTGMVRVGERLDRGEIPRADVAAVLLACLRIASTIGRAFEVVSGETRIDDKAAAEQIAAKVAGKPGTVVSVECKKAREKSPLLYDLTSLQRDANKRFGFSAERTLKAAQALYEQRKALTYPRTDSRYLTSDMKPQLKKVARTLEPFSEYARAVQVVTALKEIPPRIVDDEKVSDHHAIIPTPVRHDASGWTDDERKVFDLVARRFLAVFHPDAEYDQTTVISEVESERFRTRGKVILNAGWRAVYDAVPDEADDKKADDEDEGARLPALAQGAPVDCTGAAVEEKKTKPPAHFNENLLLAAMETAGKLVDDDELREAMKDGGLGTPATRAAIIETLIRRGYVKRKGKRLLATEKGIQTIELLDGHPLTSAELTGLWEKKLSEVARGKLDRDTFMAMIRRFTADDVAATIATLSSPTLGAPPVDDLCPCPRCGATIRETPRAFSCSSWKSKDESGCGFVVWKQIAKRRLSADEAATLIRQGRTGVLNGFVSAKGKPFAAALALGPDGTPTFEFPRNRGGDTSDGALSSAPNGEKR